MSSKPRRRRIEVEDIGDVTVVNFVDRKLLDEQNLQVIFEQLFALVDEEGRRKIVLNMGNIDFISSALVGKLITFEKKLQWVHGRLAICSVPWNIMEGFESWGKDKFHRFFKTESAAVEYLLASWGDDILFACPMSGCSGSTRINPAGQGEAVCLRCPECGVLYDLVVPEIEVGNETLASVSRLSLKTYTDQEITLIAGRPMWVGLPSRLDLFTSEHLRRLWETIPPPRCIIINGAYVRELSEQGVAVLRELVGGAEDDKVILLVDKDRPPKGASFPPELPLYTSEAEAMSALGDLAAEAHSPLTTRVVRSQER